MKLVVEKKRDKLVELLADAILSEKALDQRKVDYLRGFSDGSMSVVQRPENAERDFNDALKRLAEGSVDG